MRKTLISLFLGIFTIYQAEASTYGNLYYGVSLCKHPQYECLKISSGQTWEKLFPNPQERDIVQRINRSYTYLWAGKIIAIPRNLQNKTLLDFSPFPLKIKDKEKQVIVDQEKLAWAAYSAEGKLIHWGPISSGSDRCSDGSSKTCRTITGLFRFFSKEGDKCRSNVFPVGKGGAKMPYCMYFHKGFALHGSNEIPGYRASHGCIRIFTEDALWLNHEFVELSKEENQYLGTKIVVKPLISGEKINEKNTIFN